MVAGEDDQVVRAASSRALDASRSDWARTSTSRPVRASQLEERKVVAAEVARDAAVQEGAPEPDGAVRPARVPGVALAVAVVVAEVVRLPRQGRHHDRDAVLAEARGPDDERREPDSPVRGVEPGEVEAARPVADRDGDDEPSRARPDVRLRVTATPSIVTLPTVRARSGPTRKSWRVRPLGAVRRRQGVPCSRGVAFLRKRGLDGRRQLDLGRSTPLVLLVLFFGDRVLAVEAFRRTGKVAERHDSCCHDCEERGKDTRCVEVMLCAGHGRHRRIGRSPPGHGSSTACQRC